MLIGFCQKFSFYDNVKYFYFNEETTNSVISSLFSDFKRFKRPFLWHVILAKTSNKEVLLKNSLDKLAKWLCRQLTCDEFASIVPLFLEILSGTRSGFEFKPEPRTENYRKFLVDLLPPLSAPPSLAQVDWRELKDAIEKQTGKLLKPVRRRGGFSVPEHCRCERCNAPADFLYLNDGQKGNQVRCKICNHLGTTGRIRQRSGAKYFCPHCGSALSVWKQSAHETIYKCFSYKCPHYLTQESRLTGEERVKRQAQKFDPNYKLHYQYREYHLKPEDLLCRRPESPTNVDLRSIHNSHHVVGLVLTFFVNAGVSSRLTRDLLWGLFGIKLSHQTVINYVNAAAARIAPFLDADLPKPGPIAAADETYLIVENEWHYTWFIIDAASRAICGYNLSDTRGTVPALATLNDAYGKPETNQGKQFILVRDGLPSYDSALLAYNQGLEAPVLTGPKVIGLENLDEISKEFRPYKQLVERLNRTYKFHTRPRAGMKSMEGATCLTTLFVAYYNYLRPHGGLKHSPLSREPLQGIERYPKQWETLLAMAAA